MSSDNFGNRNLTYNGANIFVVQPSASPTALPSAGAILANSASFNSVTVSNGVSGDCATYSSGLALVPSPCPSAGGSGTLTGITGGANIVVSPSGAPTPTVAVTEQPSFTGSIGCNGAAATPSPVPTGNYGVALCVQATASPAVQIGSIYPQIAWTRILYSVGTGVSPPSGSINQFGALVSSVSTSDGEIYMGGTSSSCLIDYGVTTSGAITLACPLHVGGKATANTPNPCSAGSGFPCSGQVTCSLSSATTCTVSVTLQASGAQCSVAYDASTTGTAAQVELPWASVSSATVTFTYHANTTLTGTAVMDYVCT
jgi:hypothetical protein